MTVMLMIMFAIGALTILATSWLAMYIGWSRGYRKGHKDGEASYRESIGWLIENVYAPKQEYLRSSLEWTVGTRMDPHLAALEVK